MSEITVRRLLIDLEAPIGRNWCGGDAFASAFLNALSMSFPQGEQFFIDAVRRAVASLPEADRPALEGDLRGFVGQEATHRRLHTLFNAHLQRQGLVDGWTPRAAPRLDALAGADPRHAVAVTAATEHFTALFSGWLLDHPEVFAGTEPRLATLWRWHCAEELEHRHVAFDVYRATGGSEFWRRRWFRRASVFFLSDLARQTIDNLRREGQLWKLATWKAGWRLLFRRGGLLRSGFAAWRSYFRADFHPLQDDGAAGARWLADNRSSYSPVGAAASS